ncbi:class I SAM-dependent methyltransferase [Pseudaestuariivita atlantica]|uniref:Methyltransferase small domain-containing protein n=1 Tax=Pseudaestuariivita atlantica TaxID=1317121 RepID=A0A0L1JRT0_9RHOB|nr:class I SAM-dependent methyltransferase [Pseudaestuariivita atlantica]KNG94118.1 hypothetical protein ATO11_07710 [Pseudaestuariivita atlantica]
MSPRLTLAVSSGEVEPDGRICVVGAGRDADLGALPKNRTTIVQPLRPDHDALAAAGFDVAVDWPGTADMVIVVLPRAKALAFDWIARAAQVATRQIVIDGQKTDGVESVLKAVKARVAIDGSLSKAHGKLAWFAPDAALADLAPPPLPPVDGFTVVPGVFSADAIDPGSRALAEALPDRLGREVADFGAGWGYLSARVLKDDGVTRLHLVEADHIALDCARRNIDDPRAVFHWADATTWRSDAPLDAVVMNPPFHTGRRATPDLGHAFIRNAARGLSRHGRLWLVANRHLPYEQVLESCFGKVTEHPSAQGGYKIIEAAQPRAPR